MAGGPFPVSVIQMSSWDVEKTVSVIRTSAWNTGLPVQANMTQMADVPWISTYPS